MELWDKTVIPAIIISSMLDENGDVTMTFRNKCKAGHFF